MSGLLRHDLRTYESERLNCYLRILVSLTSIDESLLLRLAGFYYYPLVEKTRAPISSLLLFRKPPKKNK